MQQEDDEDGWVSCSQQLPPKNVWVRVRLNEYRLSEEVVAKRKGLFTNYWLYPSGLKSWSIWESDSWKEINNGDTLNQQLKDSMKTWKKE